MISFCIIIIPSESNQIWSEYYPDSAVVIGSSYHNFATGESSGNRVSVRDSRGWIHVVYSTGYGIPYANDTEIMHVYSTDNGETWLEPINVSRTDSLSSDEPTLAIDSDNVLHCLWRQAYRVAPESTWHRYLFYSQFDGDSWSLPYQVTMTPNSGTSLYSSLIVDSYDRLHAVWDEQLAPFGSDYDIFYSCYNGTTWSGPYNISDDNYDSAFPCLAIDSGDTLHLVWRKRVSGHPIMYSKYNGINWSTHSVIATTPNASWSGAPIIIVNSISRPQVIWSNDATGNAELYYIQYIDTAWTLPYNLSNSDHNSVGPNISIDTSGNLHIVWMEDIDLNRYDIYYRTHSNGSWQESMNLTEDTEGSYCPKLGDPISPNGVDLIWTSGFWPHFDIVYMRLNLAQGIEENQNPESVIKDIVLFQNKSNPFVQFTDISYQITNTGMEPYSVQLKVYDINGREIKELVDGYKPAGLHTVRWDGKNNKGIKVTSGIYFSRLQVRKYFDVKRILLVKK